MLWNGLRHSGPSPASLAAAAAAGGSHREFGLRAILYVKRGAVRPARAARGNRDVKRLLFLVAHHYDCNFFAFAAAQCLGPIYGVGNLPVADANHYISGAQTGCVRWTALLHGAHQHAFAVLDSKVVAKL